MSSKYIVTDNSIPHFLTFTVVGWVDVFSRERYCEIMCDSLLYCAEKKGLLLHAWVIMTNHVHLIVSCTPPYAIFAFVRDCKKYTSKRIITAIENNEHESWKNWMLNMFRYAGQSNNNNELYQFWQTDYHPIALDTLEKARQRLNYLHENPVRAGMVWRHEHHKYSSAIDYHTSGKGLLPIHHLYL